MIDPFSLNIRHLRALALIVERGRMSEAAEAAGLSQPALTQGLAKIEKQLGAMLFERRNDGMTATDAGRAVAERAQAAFAHLAAGARKGTRGFTRPERLMTSTQLRAFLNLADAGSFAGAAVRSGQSQPALHRAVRDLEQLGSVPLVERRGRGVALTPAGRAMARGIRLAAAEISAAIAETSPDGSTSGKLVIGAMPLPRARLLPKAIARMTRAAPRATIDVVEGSWRELVDPLRDGQIDLMVGALRDEAPEGLEQMPLFADRLAIVARAGHPLSGGGSAPDLDALSRYPWIVGRADTPLRGHWDALFAGRALPRAPIECGSVMTIRGILVESDFLTLLSLEQVAMEVEAGVLTTIGPPRAELVRTIGITTRGGWRMTALQSTLIDLLRRVASEPGLPEIQ